MQKGDDTKMWPFRTRNEGNPRSTAQLDPSTAVLGTDLSAEIVLSGNWSRCSVPELGKRDFIRSAFLAFMPVSFSPVLNVK